MDERSTRGTKQSAVVSVRSVPEEISELVGESPKWIILVGPLTSAAIIVSLVRDQMVPWRLALWGLVIVTMALINFALQYAPVRTKRTKRGVPFADVLAAIGMGLAFGSVLWVDMSVTRDSVAQSSLVAVLFAVSAGSIGGAAGRRGLSSYLLGSMWIVASSALLYAGAWAFGIGSVLFVFLISRDLDETHDLVAEVLRLKNLSRGHAASAESDSRHDSLTGLLNRSGLDSATAAMKKRESANQRATVTTLFVDLDHFKLVNDRFGHLAGDQVLVEVAERLRQEVRSDDIVARLGGDEFFLILGGEFSDERRDSLVSSIIRTIERPFMIDSHEARISASIGVSVVPITEFDLVSVQGETDHAMYFAKAAGRRRSVRFDDRIKAELEQKSELETSLRSAVSNGELEAWSRDLIDFDTADPVMTKVFPRWRLDTGKLCPESVFIPMAEEIGLINDLSKQILDQAACLIIKNRSLDTSKTLPVSITMSAWQNTDPEFLACVRETVFRYKLLPGELVLELNDAHIGQDHEELKTQLNQLVGLGVHICLGDFGNSHLSIDQLLGLPIEFVKLEGATLARLGAKTAQPELPRLLHELASSLGKTVFATRSESASRAHILPDPSRLAPISTEATH